jgi:hypothetical protein
MSRSSLQELFSCLAPPRDILRAISLARAAYRKMVQHLVWATVYKRDRHSGSSVLVHSLETQAAHECGSTGNESLNRHCGTQRPVPPRVNLGHQCAPDSVHPVAIEHDIVRIPHIDESSTQVARNESTSGPSSSWNFKTFIDLDDFDFRPVWTTGPQAVLSAANSGNTLEDCCWFKIHF